MGAIGEDGPVLMVMFGARPGDCVVMLEAGEVAEVGVLSTRLLNPERLSQSILFHDLCSRSYSH
jgi:hypothetical protein